MRQIAREHIEKLYKNQFDGDYSNSPSDTFDQWLDTDEANKALHIKGLSKREREVLPWVLKGKTNAEIGHCLFISPRTVSKHLEKIYSKLGVESRTAALGKVLQIMEENRNGISPKEKHDDALISKHRVLIVDEDLTIREFLCDLLEIQGYECVGMSNETAAITFLEKSHVDVVITDNGLPILRAIQFFECISAKNGKSSTPVILHHRILNSELTNQAHKAGAFAMLHKPCKLSQLLLVVEEAIQYRNSASR